MHSKILISAIGVTISSIALIAVGCGDRNKSDSSADPKWEKAHAKAQEVIELINVQRKASDRSYYYPREVADLDSDGVYEVIVGWHPQGGPEGTDLLMRIVGDTMVISPDSAVLWHEGAQMHFDSQKLIVVYPLWSSTDSACCPSIDVRQVYRVTGDRATAIAVDTIHRHANP